MSRISQHPLFQTLRELKGNPRICVLTEPLFGLPYNMFYPFMSVYMLALGVTDKQIGAIASLGLLAQLASTAVSGAITDRFGRRVTLLWGDIVSFGVACLIWAASQNVTYFVVAALINGTWRISHTAWTCLMVEGVEEERHMVHIWTWITIFGTGAAFFTPLGGWFVARYGLVPAMRGLLLAGFALLTFKAVFLYYRSTETERGLQRMQETRGKSIISLLGEYRGVLSQLFHNKVMLGALGLLAVTNIYRTVSGSFWGVLFAGKLGFPDAQIALYMALRSVAVTVFIFTVSPRLNHLPRLRLPLWVGFGAFFVSEGLLVFMRPGAGAVPLLVLSVLLEAFAASLVTPMTEALLSVALETHERARLTAMIYVVLIGITTPFGWIAGQLSAIDRSLPFALLMALFAAGAVLIWFVGRWQPSLAAKADRV